MCLDRSAHDGCLSVGQGFFSWPGEKMWKYGCPRSPVWSDDGLEEERGENTSSVEYYEHTVDGRSGG